MNRSSDNCERNLKADQPRLGELLVKGRLITERQLQEALEIQRSLPKYAPLGQILVDNRFITPKQLDLFIDANKKRPRLGEILLKNKTISREQLEIALQQKKKGHRLGEALLNLNCITEEALKRALSLQFNIPFVDLDKEHLDSRLEKYISKSYAQKHHVVPIKLVQNVLTVAVEDPTDFAVIQELRNMPGVQLNVATATRGMIGRAFNRIYENGRLSGVGDLVIDENFEFPQAGKTF